MSLDAYLADLRNLELNLQEEIENIIKDNEGFLVGLIKNRLYQHGIDADGKPILPDYAPSTVKRKKEDNQRSSHVTLRDTGDFYQGMFIEVKNWIITASSTDGKTDSLIEKYGEGILGFTQEEQDQIVFSIVEPRIQKIIDSFGPNINI